MTALRWLGSIVLVLVTLLCLSSMGGAMLFAFPVLVPLHWLSARRSGPVATAGWALLAGLSLFEAGWMLTYLATGTGHEAVSLSVGAVVGVATVAGFLSRRLDLVGPPVPRT